MNEPCPNAARMKPYDCADRHQCWEPCGELGKSEEHARPAPTREELNLLRPVLDFAKLFWPAPHPPPAPGCQPLKQLTEEDVRRIVREELAKQPAPWALRSIGGHP